MSSKPSFSDEVDEIASLEEAVLLASMGLGVRFDYCKDGEAGRLYWYNDVRDCAQIGPEYEESEEWTHVFYFTERQA